jgi:hypothetical protein
MIELFGPPISTYTRAQAIADGVLVDVSELRQPNPFKYPVAMTQAAFAATVEAGGTWEANGEGQTLKLPNGQDVPGRLHDVFWMLQSHLDRNGPGERVDFSVLVDVHGIGRHTKVDLYAVCGPGDDGEPVITIMLPGED